MDEKILLFSEVKKMIGLSRTAIWRLERSGDFPKRKQISAGRVGWKLSEIFEWINQRPDATGFKYSKERNEK